MQICISLSTFRQPGPQKTGLDADAINSGKRAFLDITDFGQRERFGGTAHVAR